MVDRGDKEYGRKKIGFQYLLTQGAAKKLTLSPIVESGALIHLICAFLGVEFAWKWSVEFRFP